VPIPVIRRRIAASLLRDADALGGAGDWDGARASFRQACDTWPRCAANWLQDGATRLAALERLLSSSPPEGLRLFGHLRTPSPESCAAALRFAPAEARRLRAQWLHYTVEQPFNLFTLLPALGIRRIVLYGGEGWGLATYRQLAPAGVACVAVIDNAASTRATAMVPAPYFSVSDYLASGPKADAILSSLRGDHDLRILSKLQRAPGLTGPVLSWKMLFSLLAEPTAWQDAAVDAAPERATLIVTSRPREESRCVG
jgi:hypothetical protein